MASTSSTSSTTSTSSSAGYGTTISTKLFLNNFYSSNRDAAKSSTRGNLSNAQLIIEDSTALRKASRKLTSYENTSDSLNNEEDIINTVKAYVEVYNNANSSVKKSDTYSMKKFDKKLQELTEKYSDELEDIGITVDSDGKMKVSDNLLKAAGKDKIKKVFGSDTGYTTSLRSLSKKINAKANDIMYAELTGNGSKINLIL